MAFKIQDIKGALKFGGARPTLFQVSITKTEFSTLRTIAPFMIQSTQIPSSSITSIDVPYFGRKIKVAGDRTFDTWSVTILNDEDFALRHIFEEWHNRINSLYTNINQYGSAAPAEYKTDAHVIQYSKAPGTDGKKDPLRVYMFSGIFPTDISPIELDWGSTDTIETFSVTFAYDFFEVVGGSTETIQQTGSTFTDFSNA